MKNLDIEKLERKNIYSIPDSFFETVQENVLSETVYKIKNEDHEITLPKNNKKWWYAAAVMLMLFGSTFFYISKNNSENAVAQNDLASENIKSIRDFKIHNSQETAQKQKATENYIAFTDDLTFIQKQDQKSNITNNPKKTKNKKNEIAAPKPEEQVDQILDAFSAEEVALISHNMEQDIYLDIYN